MLPPSGRAAGCPWAADRLISGGACCAAGVPGAVGPDSSGRAALWGPAAVCAGGRRPASLMVLLVAPLVFRAPSGPAAREIATREPAARKCRSRSPPVPSGPSGALHTGGAWLLMCGSVRRLVVRPGPAAAHGRRSRNSRLSLLLAAPLVFRAPSGPAAREIATRELRSEWSISKPARALRTLRRPPHQWCLVADVWLGALTRCPARLRHGPRASQISRVKPVSPLLAQA